ncbi:MAG: hypothetical protein HFI04_14030 [Lachnospiraceae bacterium]|nr:hypothetical protein [Lachnospiraceae bacterium]
MAHNNDIRNPLFASAIAEWERRCGRLEGGLAGAGEAEFPAVASNQ